MKLKKDRKHRLISGLSLSDNLWHYFSMMVSNTGALK